MKAIIYTHPDKISCKLQGFEELTVSEMFKIRGGGTDDKSKTKDIDIYDTRES
jgi:hypothetical protein